MNSGIGDLVIIVMMVSFFRWGHAINTYDIEVCTIAMQLCAREKLLKNLNKWSYSNC